MEKNESTGLTRRDFLRISGLIAVGLALGGTIGDTQTEIKSGEKRVLTDFSLAVGKGWKKAEIFRLWRKAFPKIEDFLKEEIGLRAFLPPGKDKIFIDADTENVLRIETGGTVLESGHVLVSLDDPSGKVPFDLLAYRTIPHEVFHASGNLVPVFQFHDFNVGRKFRLFLNEGPANWVGDYCYNQFCDPNFEETLRLELPLAQALKMSKKEAESLSLWQKHLAWGNIWRHFEDRARQLGREQSLAFHLRERYFDKHPGGDRPSLREFFSWADEWVPEFSKTIRKTPVCQL